MLLYYSPGACSLAPHIVVREAGIALDLVRVDLKANLTEQGDDFLQINAKGSIPELVLDDGTVLTEGAVISQFLVAELPILEIVSTVHLVVDLNLGPGEVVHDYLADAAATHIGTPRRIAANG